MRWLPLLALVLVGCASAGNGGASPDAADGPGPDGALPDASTPGPDAAPMTVTLSQNTSVEVLSPNSFACSQTTTGYTRDNSYYRVFPLSDHGVTGVLRVTNVTFKVETATAGGGQPSQPAQVKIGTYVGALGGDLALSGITPITSEAITIPNGSATEVQVTIDPPAVIPAGSANVIIELAIPDGLAAQNTFFIGSNNAGEQRPGYIRSDTCGIAVPRGVNTVGAMQDPPLNKADIILTATGNY